MIVPVSTFRFDTFHVEPSTTFAERFAYARVLRHFFGGDAPGNAEIGKAAERTGQWVTKWAESSTPPRDFEVHRPVTAYLLTPVTGRDADLDERWLFRNQGEPPYPDLWEIWVSIRRLRLTRMPKPIKPQDLPRLVAERYAQVYGTKKKPSAK